MKKFNTKAEFVKYVKDLINSKDDHYMYRNYKQGTIVLIDMIEKRSTIEELVKNINDYAQGVGLSTGGYYSTPFYSFMRNNPYFFSIFLVGDERLFAELEGQVIHIFDALGLSKTDVVGLSKVNLNIWNELFFEYYSFYGMEKEALSILEKSKITDLVPESIYARDYKVVLAHYKDDRKMIKRVISAYFKMFYKENFQRDMDIHNWIYKKYSKFIKKVDSSGFDFEETDWRNSGKNNIADIDMFESNYAFRSQTISFKNGYRTFRDLAVNYPDRTEKAVIKHFNSEHKNGRASKTFMRDYVRLNSFLEINIFELDEKLQSLVLLNKIS